MQVDKSYNPLRSSAPFVTVVLAQLITLYEYTQSNTATVANAFHLLQQSDIILKMHNWSLEQRILILERHSRKLEEQLLRQDCVFVRRDEQEDRLSGIDEQVEWIRNDIEMFGDRILELEKSRTSEDLKGHSNADIAGANALVDFTMDVRNSEDSV